MFACIFIDCDGHHGRDEAILHGQQGIARRLARIEHKLEIIHEEEDEIMTKQDDVNAMVAQVGATVDDLSAKSTAVTDALARIDAAIAALPEDVDTTELVAAKDALAAAQSGIDASIQALVDDPNIPTTPPVV